MVCYGSVVFDTLSGTDGVTDVPAVLNRATVRSKLEDNRPKVPRLLLSVAGNFLGKDSRRVQYLSTP